MPAPVSRRVLTFRSLLLGLLLPLLQCAAFRASAQAPLPVHIGNSVVVLTAPWKFHPGDDPAFAQPDFDDAQWDTFDLTPAPGSYDPVVGSGGFVPGWTVHGYPHLIGFAWYRLKTQVVIDSDSGAAPKLAMLMPLSFDDAYQVYFDGRLIAEFGKFHATDVIFFNSQPNSFPLPADTTAGLHTIAIRLWMDSSTPLISTDAGGLHGPPMLGQASSIDAMLRLEWDDINRTELGNAITCTFLLLAAILGFTLFWFDRRESAYLWLGLACSISVLSRAIVIVGYYTAVVPLAAENIFLDVIFNPLFLGLWALFWAHWFKLDEIRIIRRSVWLLTGLLAATLCLIRPPLFGRYVPVSAATWLTPLSLILRLAIGVLLLWTAFRGIRKRSEGGWLVLVPILLMIFWSYQEELSTIHIPSIIRLGGLTINFSQIASFFMLGIISTLLMRRFISGQREREHYRLEIEQARQVQQVLIPEELPTIPGFQLASVYRPAQQVGGDFFQIMRMPTGGVLAIIGDVSGKGMPAAMTVSLLVGTVRTLAHYTTRPGEMLTAMNIRMLGRSQGGFTTCLVLHVAADGLVTVANAGHLSPYINGREFVVEPGLPLGLSADTSYSESTFRLAENQQLTLISDGVVEARDASGALFGFERTAALATQSAESIADAAQTFGQADDITVLTLTRVAATEQPATKVNTSVLSIA